MGIGGTGINILDRVGGGDAFASGLIYAMLHDYKAMDMINFAVASSAIKHTIHGDANITDDVSSCLLYTSPSPRDRQKSRMPSSA